MQKQKVWMLQLLLQRFLVKKRTVNGTFLTAHWLWTRFGEAPPTTAARHGTLVSPSGVPLCVNQEIIHCDWLAVWLFFSPATAFNKDPPPNISNWSVLLACNVFWLASEGLAVFANQIKFAAFPKSSKNAPFNPLILQWPGHSGRNNFILFLLRELISFLLDTLSLLLWRFSKTSCYR